MTWSRGSHWLLLSSCVHRAALLPNVPPGWTTGSGPMELSLLSTIKMDLHEGPLDRPPQLCVSSVTASYKGLQSDKPAPAEGRTCV